MAGVGEHHRPTPPQTGRLVGYEHVRLPGTEQNSLTERGVRQLHRDVAFLGLLRSDEETGPARRRPAHPVGHARSGQGRLDVDAIGDEDPTHS
ncbi:hypothetical protein [Gordonia hongkongensis]|uniref:hypothetical protein n=1 Tax=Gordonia hongkongensis TaxID=1701090 RepID=UPI003D14861B